MYIIWNGEMEGKRIRGWWLVAGGWRVGRITVLFVFAHAFFGSAAKKWDVVTCGSSLAWPGADSTGER
jgi:hypothetical protein